MIVDPGRPPPAPSCPLLPPPAIWSGVPTDALPPLHRQQDGPMRVIVFAKAPVAGFAKTRLIPALGAQGAAKLARRMLHTTVAHALEARLGVVELCMTPGYGHAMWQTVALPKGVIFSSQIDGDLGARMAHAAKRPLARGESVLLIGTDCVEMGAPLLRRAAIHLQRVDAVIHATVDGGYAVLGLKRYHPSLFRHIMWGGASVAKETIRRIHRLGWSIVQGAVLHDIDEPQDLQASYFRTKMP